MDEQKLRLAALRGVERASRLVFSHVEAIAAILGDEMPALEEMTDEEREIIRSIEGWIAIVPYMIEGRIREAIATKFTKLQEVEEEIR